ncbi:Nuclease (SNase domain-containing protein) (fragment) [Hyella patelloides LEGE 07179]|uniref:Nuclease (SNase domain-containing protein) n=2 Tax=Hyella TaxID=945733 RepID=A0A563VZB4_9CYAN
MLKPDFEKQIHALTWMVENEMAILSNHEKCLGAENLEWVSQL